MRAFGNNLFLCALTAESAGTNGARVLRGATYARVGDHLPRARSAQCCCLTHKTQNATAVIKKPHALAAWRVRY